MALSVTMATVKCPLFVEFITRKTRSLLYPFNRRWSPVNAPSPRDNLADDAALTEMDLHVLF